MAEDTDVGVPVDDSGVQTISIQDTTIEESLQETRRIINRQLDIAENINDESFKMIRINLVFIGGIATFMFSATDLFTNILLYVVAGMFFVSISLLISSYMYGSMALYGGFGDSPSLNFDSLTGVDLFEDHEAVKTEYETIRENLPEPDEFLAILLADHEKGVLHNNVEIKFCWSILRHSSVMLYLGIMMIAVGIGQEFLPVETGIQSLAVDGISVLLFLLGLAMVLKVFSLISDHMNRLEDEERFDYDYYGHDFFQDLPLFLAKYYLQLYNRLFSRN